jgi:hypothetical protein
MNGIDAGLISLDLPRPHHDDIDNPGARHGSRRRRGMSAVLAWGPALALAGALVVAADITTPHVRHQRDGALLAQIDATGPYTRGMPPVIVTQRRAVAGEQITVLVAGAALGTRREGMCGPVDLRFDGRPVHYAVQYLRFDPSEPDVMSTAAMVVPAGAPIGEHEIELYAPASGIWAGPVCAEGRGPQVSIAVASIIVVRVPPVAAVRPRR